MSKQYSLLEAAIMHYESQKAEALATLNIYFQNPVGIGEHSNFLDEVKKWSTNLSEADDNLRALQKYFIKNNSKEK
nr:hypothetical protein [Rhodospirillales bacterium]